MNYKNAYEELKRLYERLEKENARLKDSIDLQLEVIKQLNIDNELLPEEKELYDYAESLKERVSYLERSIVRKEETITELEQERVPYTNEYVDKVDKENKELKKQQQEFINYLEDEIQSCEAVSDLLFNSNKEMKVYKEILQKYKEVIDKAMEYINKNLILVSILDGVKTFGLNSYTFDYKELLDILKEVE